MPACNQIIGAKVGLKEVTYPESVVAGQTYTLAAKMVNLGDVPPFRPKRINNSTIPKDIAASYQISFQLIKDNQVAFAANADLNPPSDNWTTNQEITFSSAVPLSANLTTGDYELRLALFDPEGRDKFRQEYFRFLNKDILDSEGKAKIGAIYVQGTSVTPTTILSPAPTQATGAGWFLNFKTEFEGKDQDRSFLIKFMIKGQNFLKYLLYPSETPYRTTYLKVTELTINQAYDFILSSFPFLKSKRNYFIKPRVNPTGSVADFGNLNTGDLNGDNQINGLD